MRERQRAVKLLGVGGMLLAGLLSAGGCGPRTGTVSGKVKYRQQTLTTGSVVFFGANGEVVSSLISSGGTYHMPRVNAGVVHVAVVSHPPVPQGLQGPQPFGPHAGARTGDAARASASSNVRAFLPIPEKYSRPEHSDLTLTVGAGSQTLDIEFGP